MFDAGRDTSCGDGAGCGWALEDAGTPAVQSEQAHPSCPQKLHVTSFGDRTFFIRFEYPLAVLFGSGTWLRLPGTRSKARVFLFLMYTPLQSMKEVQMHKRKQRTKPSVEIAPLLTIPQVAEILNVGRTTVYDLIHREGLPAVPLGGRGNLRISQASLQQWLQEREKRPGA
jgi:excisionase family DNA binding protein